MTASRPRLYVDAQFTSPYALSVFVVLREKGIDFDLLPLDLDAGQNREAAYAQLSQTQRVPTLMLNRLILNGDPVPANLRDYAQRQWQRPAVQEWLHLQRPTL